MSKKKMSQNSLDNLKMGSQARNQGKVKCNITILPETKEWLSRNGNLSGRIDELVGKYLRGDLVGSGSLREARERCKQLEAQLMAKSQDSQK